MATDTALAVGLLALLRNRFPTITFAFLTALAIIDDLGAILVIATVHSIPLQHPWHHTIWRLSLSWDTALGGHVQFGGSLYSSWYPSGTMHSRTAEKAASLDCSTGLSVDK